MLLPMARSHRALSVTAQHKKHDVMISLAAISCMCIIHQLYLQQHYFEQVYNLV
jgi:hypothetical protein